MIFNRNLDRDKKINEDIEPDLYISRDTYIYFEISINIWIKYTKRNEIKKKRFDENFSVDTIIDKINLPVLMFIYPKMWDEKHVFN